MVRRPLNNNTHMNDHNVKIAVIGVGNLLVSDDGVGIRVLREFRGSVADTRVTCFECERGGLDLLDKLANFDRAIVIDAAMTDNHPQGTVLTFTLRKPFTLGTLPSLHTIDLDAVLAFGSVAGVKLPDEVTVYTVEAADIETFGAGCTPNVRSAIPDVVAQLKSQLLELLPDIRFASPLCVEAVS